MSEVFQVSMSMASRKNCVGIKMVSKENKFQISYSPGILAVIFTTQEIKKDDAATARAISPKSLAAEGERIQNFKYKNWHNEHSYYNLSFVITSRGALGQDDELLLEWIKVVSRRKGKLVNISQLKKDIMVTIKKSNTAAINNFTRQMDAR
ncbi:MAG: hypothetical protein EZS28_025165 [Streblomastix strix]|uniref:Uncharacterized protein n=1 Tax=Streblomastix strix TaxID=222440 RepID=A0A5J4VA57_9EUKA|nr:MAG: hypothetical protein EZS28_025165 [Streblomastix strix]